MYDESLRLKTLAASEVAAQSGFHGTAVALAKIANDMMEYAQLSSLEEVQILTEKNPSSD